jgi:hypothetical protein
VKPDPHYRRDAFVAGLEACGYRLTDRPGSCDLLLTWNRIGIGDAFARGAEDRGVPVLVAENGYLGNDFAGDRWYALSRGQHNGAGRWPAGGGERWDSLGHALMPWRNSGDEIVVLPQRGIGPAGVAMPMTWTDGVAARLKRYGLPVRVRRHPGVQPCKPLLDDLARAAAVVTWGSGAALKALAAGIPALYDFGQWIGGAAAARLGEEPMRDDAARLGMFRRLAWAQWRLREIADGSAIKATLA